MNLYHIYCRGIECKDIFIDDLDYCRFIQSLWIFNNTKRTRFDLTVKPDRKILIDLIEFCLMPNHFHLLIRTEDPANIGKYMQKIMIAYTMYFKERYKKSGRVFESRYRSKYIQNSVYLRHIIKYIHNNPLSLKYNNYKSIDMLNGIFLLNKDGEKWLNEYRYSSRNYTEVKPPLTARFDLD